MSFLEENQMRDIVTLSARAILDSKTPFWEQHVRHPRFQQVERWRRSDETRTVTKSAKAHELLTQVLKRDTVTFSHARD